MIHYIHRIDFDNVGDAHCGAYQYLKTSGVIHDIDAITWPYIKRDDVVILGGGGLLNVTNSFNNNIKRLFGVCDNIIGYSLGINNTPTQPVSEDITPYLKEMKCVSLRDFNNPYGIPYVPCPSVFAVMKVRDDLLINDTIECSSSVGVIHHKDYSIKNIPFPCDNITNSSTLYEIVRFILEHELIITSSYHCCYWAQLLQTKVLVTNTFSDKFDFFEHPPVRGVENMDAALQQEALPKFAQECMGKNIDFKNQLNLYTRADDNSMVSVLSAQLANANWKIYTLEQQIKNLKRRT